MNISHWSVMQCTEKLRAVAERCCLNLRGADKWRVVLSLAACTTGSNVIFVYHKES
jgi:hypothetical protein